MLEPFALPFMQRALIGGALVALLASYFGPFIVQRRMAFLGSGLAHAAFGGVALGILLGAEPLWTAVPFTIAVAAAIVWVRNRTGLASDTAIGIFFSASMALGIVFMGMKTDYTRDAYTYLFGSILYVTVNDLLVTAAVVAAVAFLAPQWGRWAYATFDPNLARADRLRIERDEYVLTIAIAVAIVVAMKVVGILLIAAFLVLPAAIARMLSRSFAAMTLWSLAIGVATAEAGLLLSYYFNQPGGAAIILLQSVLFFALLAVSRLRRA